MMHDWQPCYIDHGVVVQEETYLGLSSAAWYTSDYGDTPSLSIGRFCRRLALLRDRARLLGAVVQRQAILDDLGRRLLVLLQDLMGGRLNNVGVLRLLLLQLLLLLLQLYLQLLLLLLLL